MVNGPGTVILIVRSVLARRNCTSRTSTGCLRRTLPTTRGTGLGWPQRSSAVPGIVDVDAFERGGEAVGIALAPHLAVGDDVEAGAFLVADGEQRGVVLRLVEKFRRDPPQLLGAHARRKAAGELLAVDQPVRLRVGADQRGRQQGQRHCVRLRSWPGLSRHPAYEHIARPQRSSPARARHAAPRARRRHGSDAGTRCRRRRSACRPAPCAPPAAATARPS